ELGHLLAVGCRLGAGRNRGCRLGGALARGLGLDRLQFALGLLPGRALSRKRLLGGGQARRDRLPPAGRLGRLLGEATLSGGNRLGRLAALGRALAVHALRGLSRLGGRGTCFGELLGDGSGGLLGALPAALFVRHLGGRLAERRFRRQPARALVIERGGIGSNLA